MSHLYSLASSSCLCGFETAPNVSVSRSQFLSPDTLMARVDHLPPDEFWVRNGDVLLRCGGQCFLGHRAVLALNSTHLSALIAVQAEQEGCDRAAGLPLVSVLPAALSEGAPAGAHFGTFLHLLYRTRSDFEVSWELLLG